MKSAADAWIRCCARLTAGCAVLLPRRTRRRFGSAVAETLRQNVQARGDERGLRAAILCSLVEIVDLLRIAVGARARSVPARAVGGAVLVAALVGVQRPMFVSPEAVSATHPAVAPRLAAELARASRMSLDERLQVLADHAPWRFHPSTRADFLGVERTLCCSRNYRRLYDALLADDRLSEDERVDVIDAAAAHIDRSRDLASLIVSALKVGDVPPSVTEALRRAAQRIDLDPERARAHSALNRHSKRS